MIDKAWLERRYVKDIALVEDIAKEAGCTVANIRRCLKIWKIRRGRALKVESWNKGLTKDTDPRLASISENMKGDLNPLAGVVPWNKGKTASDDPKLAAISIGRKGIKFSSETRAKQAAAKIGKTGPLSNRWKGGKSYSNGYGITRVTVDGVRKYMHRHVAETCLKRELLEEEHVHHVDRNKHNNAPFNLLVMNHADHNKLHRAIDAGVTSREAQIKWLKDNKITFEELYED
jgi:hypothetical protein